MNRWLMLTTVVFSFGIVAAAPAPTPPRKPVAAGDVIVLPAKPSSGSTAMLPVARRGDPDQLDFENDCQLTAPLEAKVLGVLQDPTAESTIVVEYRTSAKDIGMFQCRNGTILLFTLDGWTKLRAAEAAAVKERADRDRRREEIRAILRQSGRSNAK